MKKMFLLLPLFAAVVFSTGCGSSQTVLPKTDVGDMPEWFTTPPSDPDFLFGAKTETSTDMQMAVDKATTAARADISRQLEVKMQGLEKQFKEEVGTGDNTTFLGQFTQATKSVTSQTLTGSKVKQNKILKDGNKFRAYVLVEYPIGAANKALMEKIKQNQELYTRFRAGQAFEDLDKSVKEYEASKNK
jgi:hypothetical protein